MMVRFLSLLTRRVNVDLNYLNGIDPNYLKDDEVKWNFTKFVIDRKGNVVGRFEPVVKPIEMEAFIKKTHLVESLAW